MELIRIAGRDPQWLSLIEEDLAATIFHHPAWMELLASCYGFRPFVLAVMDPDGRILAGLPIAEVRNIFTPLRYVSLPFSDYCTPLYQDDKALLLLSDKLVDLQKETRIKGVEIRSDLPELDKIQATSHFVLHTIPLDADPSQTAKRVSRQQMQNVRTAEKNEIQIVRGTGLEEIRAFYRLHSLTRRKHGVPVQPWKYFKLLTERLLVRGLGFILLAFKEDTCISAGVFLHWQKALTYKYSATDEAFMNLRPNHLVTWTAMKWGCENGFTVFDFGRADLENEGLRSYKRRWGAEETSLQYSYIPTAPTTSTGSNHRLNNLGKTIIRRSPVWVCRMIGELIYRYAG
jgi:hypothetical protein